MNYDYTLINDCYAKQKGATIFQINNEVDILLKNLNFNFISNSLGYKSSIVINDIEYDINLYITTVGYTIDVIKLLDNNDKIISKSITYNEGDVETNSINLKRLLFITNEYIVVKIKKVKIEEIRKLLLNDEYIINIPHEDNINSRYETCKINKDTIYSDIINENMKLVNVNIGKLEIIYQYLTLHIKELEDNKPKLTFSEFKLKETNSDEQI